MDTKHRLKEIKLRVLSAYSPMSFDHVPRIPLLASTASNERCHECPAASLRRVTSRHALRVFPRQRSEVRPVTNGCHGVRCLVIGAYISHTPGDIRCLKRQPHVSTCKTRHLAVALFVTSRTRRASTVSCEIRSHCHNLSLHISHIFLIIQTHGYSHKLHI